MKLEITVVEIHGSCPVYKIGDKITLRHGYILDPAQTDVACMHSLASVMPYYTALANGIKAADLNLSKGDSDDAFVQCLDPCEITGGGTVRLKISRLEET